MSFMYILCTCIQCRNIFKFLTIFFSDYSQVSSAIFPVIQSPFFRLKNKIVRRRFNFKMLQKFKFVPWVMVTKMDRMVLSVLAFEKLDLKDFKVILCSCSCKDSLQIMKCFRQNFEYIVRGNFGSNV